MADIDELQQAWNGMEERLEAQDRKLEAMRRRHGIDAARSRLRLMSLAQWVQLAVGMLIVLWAGGYWFDRLGQTHLVVSGVAVHLYGLGLLIAAALQLVRLACIDYREPVLQVQRQLVALRRLRAASERVLLIVGCLLWVPIMLIALAAFGMDVWITHPRVVLWNLAAGIGVAVLAAWLTYRFGAAFERDSAGRSLRELEAELAELTPGSEQKRGQV